MAKTFEKPEEVRKHIAGMSEQTSRALLADADPYRPGTKLGGRGPALASQAPDIPPVGPDSACLAVHDFDKNGIWGHELYIAGYGHVGWFEGNAKAGCSSY